MRDRDPGVGVADPLAAVRAPSDDPNHAAIVELLAVLRPEQRARMSTALRELIPVTWAGLEDEQRRKLRRLMELIAEVDERPTAAEMPALAARLMLAADFSEAELAWGLGTVVALARTAAGSPS